MYKDLSFKDRAKIIKYGVSLGLHDILDIENLYNESTDNSHLKLGYTDSNIVIYSTLEEANKALEDYGDNAGIIRYSGDNDVLLLNPVMLPETTVSSNYMNLPTLGNYTDEDVLRYAQAVAEGTLRLLDIKDLGFRNKVRFEPIGNTWRLHMNENGTKAAIGLGATVAAPYLISEAAAAAASPQLVPLFDTKVVPAVLKAFEISTRPFTPSKWMARGVTLGEAHPILGALGDAAVESYFINEGVKGLANLARENTLLTNPRETVVNTLMTLPATKLVKPVVNATKTGVRYLNKNIILPRLISKAPDLGIAIANIPMKNISETNLGFNKFKYDYRKVALESPTIDFNTARTVQELSNAQWQLLNLPGYQIKSLRIGSKLELQVSKQGTISLKNVEAWANKSDTPAIDKELLNRILEAHKDEKYIDYNTLRREVQELIPLYNRVPLTEYEGYGIDRLGFDTPPRLNTFTFESHGITGNNNHYEGDPIGHSRTYTTADEPEVLHIMESLSDWAQHPKEYKPRFRFNRAENGNTNIRFDENGLYYEVPNGEGIPYNNFINVQGLTRAEEPYTIARTLFEEAVKLNNFRDLYMMQTYLPRLIQENLRYAAENGLTKMRYPTRETAAKIEDYPYKDIFIDSNGNVVTKREAATYGNKLDKKIYDLIEERNMLEQLAKQYEHAVVGSNEFDKYNEIRNRISSINDELFRIMDKKPKLTIKKGYSVNRVYGDKYETILKKYSNFPKQYKKLFKNADVREVVDSKGNSWYEVDVPLSYLDGTAEMLFALGGDLNSQNRPNKFNIGDELDLSELEIQDLINKGYKIEYI